MTDNVISLKLHRDLAAEEEKEFRNWARENWAIDDPISPVWHPKVVEECAVILDEHVRANTKKYDAGTMDWNFVYKDQVVALDSSSEEVSEEDQYEMAIEYFWDMEWDKLTGEEAS
tara:strand:- start:6727 stop:7074 length:348 start_codon:yes stop_codon:yes gene_type:complete